MSVDQATVRRVARLARIKVTDDDVPRLVGELNSILHWIEQLNEVDISGIEPLTSVVTVKMKTRRDEVTDGHYPADVVKNAAAQEDNFFMVPKVVE
jgi:aspartyl-tRNA(Asn)/glutamyl-tRNA(Gln) amidotransferase subunit C